MVALLRRCFLMSSAACLAANLPHSVEAEPMNDLDAAIHGMSDQDLRGLSDEVGRQVALAGAGMWSGRAIALAHSAIPTARRRRASTEGWPTG